MKPRLNWMAKFGLRREAKRHAAFARTGRVRFPTGIVRPKTPSPLRSAGAVQDAPVSIRANSRNSRKSLFQIRVHRCPSVVKFPRLT
jgi:hypothetical protein